VEDEETRKKKIGPAREEGIFYSFVLIMLISS
jgi:hypothetical protein